MVVYLEFPGSARAGNIYLEGDIARLPGEYVVRRRINPPSMAITDKRS